MKKKGKTGFIIFQDHRITTKNEPREHNILVNRKKYGKNNRKIEWDEMISKYLIKIYYIFLCWTNFPSIFASHSIFYVWFSPLVFLPCTLSRPPSLALASILIKIWYVSRAKFMILINIFRSLLFIAVFAKWLIIFLYKYIFFVN